MTAKRKNYFSTVPRITFLHKLDSNVLSTKISPLIDKNGSYVFILLRSISAWLQCHLLLNVILYYSIVFMSIQKSPIQNKEHLAWTILTKFDIIQRHWIVVRQSRLLETAKWQQHSTSSGWLYYIAAEYSLANSCNQITENVPWCLYCIWLNITCMILQDIIFIHLIY